MALFFIVVLLLAGVPCCGFATVGGVGFDGVVGVGIWVVLRMYGC